MNGSPQPGAGGMGGGGMSPTLASLLGGQAPPATAMSAQTPDIRRNPTDEWYVAMQKVHITAKQAMMKAEEQDPVIKDFLSAVAQTAIKLISVGTMSKPSIANGLARAFDNFAPQIAGQLDMLAYTLAQQSSLPPQGPSGMGPPGMGGPLAGPPGGAMPPQGPPMGGPPNSAPGPGAPALV